MEPFRRGERITAARLNAVVSTLNELVDNVLVPRDVDQGAVANEVGLSVLQEVPDSRVSTEVRIENPDDSEQYVNVARAEAISLYNSATGEFSVMLLLNEE